MSRRTVEGLERLQKRIAALPVAMKTEIGKALDKGADEIVSLAQRFAPDRKPDTSEDLRRSIKSKPGDHELERLVVVESAHGRLTEFGTAPHIVGGIFAGAMHPGTQPQPFLVPAFRTEKRRVLGRVKRATSKAAKAAAKG